MSTFWVSGYVRELCAPESNAKYSEVSSGAAHIPTTIPLPARRQQQERVYVWECEGHFRLPDFKTKTARAAQ